MAMTEPWRVTNQRETTALNPDTQDYERMIEVRFVTEHGDTGMIYVPPALFSADRVRDLITTRVDELNAVRKMTGRE